MTTTAQAQDIQVGTVLVGSLCDMTVTAIRFFDGTIEVDLAHVEDPTITSTRFFYSTSTLTVR